MRVPENSPTADVAFGAGAVWMGTGTGQMLRLDPDTERERWTEGLAAIDQVVQHPDKVVEIERLLQVRRCAEAERHLLVHAAG